jgi:hypothetical protein
LLVEVEAAGGEWVRVNKLFVMATTISSTSAWSLGPDFVLTAVVVSMLPHLIARITHDTFLFLSEGLDGKGLI